MVPAFIPVILTRKLYENIGGDWMDVTSLISGIMIGAGIGLTFCTAVIYARHREVIMDEGNSKSFGPKLPEGSDNAKEDPRETNKARQ